MLQLFIKASNRSLFLEIFKELDLFWVLICSFLIFMMQLGFSLVETGIVRSKNTINVAMKNLIDTVFSIIFFWIFGFGLMFGLDVYGLFGTDKFLIDGKDLHLNGFFFFQAMFAATAITIVSGAVAERIKFNGYIIVAIVVSAIIYPIFGHWAWSENGWLKALGFIDFAGSTVVHSIGGWVALAGIIVLGPRLGRFGRKGQSHFLAGHNLPLVALGGFILWFAWFGFNAASTVAASVSIGRIALNTHLAACAAASTYMILALLQSKAVLMRHTINASLAGLVAITAGCATMSPVFAVITGAIAGLLMTFVPLLIEKMRLDDVVDAVAVHGVCGAWGTIAAGIFFLEKPFNLDVISVQTLGVGAAFVWGFGAAFIMFKVLDKVLGGLRVSPQHEQRGLDYTEHAELSYPEFQRDVTFETENITHRH